MAEPVEALVLHVALPGREDQGEVGWCAVSEEALPQSIEQLVGRAVAAITGGGDGFPGMDDRDGIRRLDDLLQPHDFLLNGGWWQRSTTAINERLIVPTIAAK